MIEKMIQWLLFGKDIPYGYGNPGRITLLPDKEELQRMHEKSQEEFWERMC